MSVIYTKNLTKRYGRRLGIKDLDLRVEAGAIFGFLGPNGSGKTTTIRILLGLLRPTQGRASVLGKNAWEHSAAIKQEVGYLPGDLRLYPWMNLKNALAVFGQVRRRDLGPSGMELAERFRLEDKVRVRSMSRGMRQKLGLILALAHEPQVLILDEPTSALDPPMQQELYAYLRERAAQGATVFFSSHALSEVEGLCDMVAILREGRLVAHEPLEDLQERAGRIVLVRWSRETAAQVTRPPAFLDLHERRGPEWHGTLTGSAKDFIQWAAFQELEDVIIGKPDLDTLFRQYYEGGGDAE